MMSHFKNYVTPDMIKQVVAHEAKERGKGKKGEIDVLSSKAGK